MLFLLMLLLLLLLSTTLQYFTAALVRLNTMTVLLFVSFFFKQKQRGTKSKAEEQAITDFYLNSNYGYNSSIPFSKSYATDHCIHRFDLIKIAIRID
mmetsp:Transcript_32483/g.79153  ORF Transcript_32483/g.79153 Transcript_32483/m.79153 type:complete len:97 (+) Transcript_32483:480-770(+)